MNYYPKNTLTHYTTKLKLPLELNTKYEVALTEIVYPFNFKFRKDGSIIFLNSMTKQREELKIQFFAFDTVTDLFASINEFLKTKAIPISFYYNKRTYKISLKITPPWTLEFTESINKEFGIKFVKIQATTPDSYFYGITQIPEQLNSINAFYIYSDIVDYQFIGDTFAPILRVIPISNKQVYGEYVCESYTTPHYVPVKRSNIDTIEIDIKTDSGEAIQFNSGKLLIKLHFRPQQNGF